MQKTLINSELRTEIPTTVWSKSNIHTWIGRSIGTWLLHTHPQWLGMQTPWLPLLFFLNFNQTTVNSEHYGLSHKISSVCLSHNSLALSSGQSIPAKIWQCRMYPQAMIRTRQQKSNHAVAGKWHLSSPVSRMMTSLLALQRVRHNRCYVLLHWCWRIPLNIFRCL